MSLTPRPRPVSRPDISAAAARISDAEAMAELRATVEALQGGRSNLLGERQLHLLLLGLAISLPFHIAIVLWLASIYLPGGRGGIGPTEGGSSITYELGAVDDEQLAEGPALDDPLAAASETGVEVTAAAAAPSALEASTPAIGLEHQGGGSLDAGGAGGGPPGDGGSSGGGGGGLGPGGGGSGGTSFFGAGGRGTRFAYIVDVSGSMSNGDRMEVAMAELKRSIAALPDFASFFVVLYSDHIREGPGQDEGFVRAMPSNIARVKRWLDEQGPMGGTEPGIAFERVLALSPPADLIFFLTDGEIPDVIPDYLSSRNGANGKKRIVIHTIAFSSDASQETLRRIARDSEGTFRFVPAGGP